jgi:pimeloyl-ACP methyl ester carboxylesterase
MALAQINGIQLGYDEYGSGDPVLFLSGTGTPGRVWRTHQVPALTQAGFRVITMDNRGIPPSDTRADFVLADMVADTAGLIVRLGIGPCRVVGFSMGAMIAQELLVAHPELVTQAVLMATRGRTDELSAAASEAELELFDSGIKLPPSYEAVTNVLRGFSPVTLRNERLVRDWLDVFELYPLSLTASRSQLAADLIPDRRPAYRTVETECLVLAYADDLMTPPHLVREVAESLPRASYREIPDCGHYGHLENPSAVNSAILEFFRGAPA